MTTTVSVMNLPVDTAEPGPQMDHLVQLMGRAAAQSAQAALAARKNAFGDFGAAMDESEGLMAAIKLQVLVAIVAWAERIVDGLPDELKGYA